MGFISGLKYPIKRGPFSISPEGTRAWGWVGGGERPHSGRAGNEREKSKKGSLALASERHAA